MRTTTKTTKIAGIALGAAAMVALGAGPALADGNVSANLRPVAGNGVAGSGTAMVTVTGTTISVTMAATGLLADSPHAAHIHFGAAAMHECPTLTQDANKDGHINVSEGAPSYGAIVVSLTKTGDTSPKSALAVDRFDTAPGGKIAYQRGSITVSSDVASAISAGKSVVVIHGVDYNKDGKYSGATKSDINPALPTEATDPALCGVLTSAPAGGMATGEGGAAASSNGALIALGGAALIGAAGTGVVAARRRRVQA